MKRMFVLFVFALLITQKSWAWGCEGHQAVAYIAERYLNHDAGVEVKRLLDSADRNALYTTANGAKLKRWCSNTNLGNMEYFATWADDERTTKDAGWHFWDIPLSKKSATLPNYCGANGCVVTAIKKELAVLTSGASDAEKVKALLYVIHLVGDLHQPMHIVDNGDRGGNCVPVDFSYTGYSKSTKQGTDGGSYEPNLHSVWDKYMIEVYSGSKSVTDAATSGWADKIIAAKDAEIRDAARPIPNDQATLVQWAVATHQLASSVSYKKLTQKLPVAANPQTLSSCSTVSSTFVSYHEKIDQKFVNNAQATVEDRIALAGGRLAGLLNAVWP